MARRIKQEKIKEIEEVFDKVKSDDESKVNGSAIHLDLIGNSIEFELLATSQKTTQLIDGETVRLISGRMYFLPIKEKEIDSDNYQFLKVYSSAAQIIDVRYVKDGIVCIVPLKHCVTLKHNEHICNIM